MTDGHPDATKDSYYCVEYSNNPEKEIEIHARYFETKSEAIDFAEKSSIVTSAFGYQHMPNIRTPLVSGSQDGSIFGGPNQLTGGTFPIQGRDTRKGGNILPPTGRRFQTESLPALEAS